MIRFIPTVPACRSRKALALLPPLPPWKPSRRGSPPGWRRPGSRWEDGTCPSLRCRDRRIPPLARGLSLPQKFPEARGPVVSTVQLQAVSAAERELQLPPGGRHSPPPGSSFPGQRPSAAARGPPGPGAAALPQGSESNASSVPSPPLGSAGVISVIAYLPLQRKML